ncbi:hypothetical protein KPL41_13745 [Clostridium gasigenes]|nr:hypothetical protein [Clostridium gasigenes]
MLILIVGGRYGSQISDEKKIDYEDFYEEYVSITRNEYRIAYENKIPIYIFIEKNVYSEYHTYSKNKKTTQ